MLSMFLTHSLFEDPEVNNLKIFTEPDSSVHLLLVTNLWTKQDMKLQEVILKPDISETYWPCGNLFEG